MVNKVTFLGFRKAIAPPLDPPLIVSAASVQYQWGERRGLNKVAGTDECLVSTGDEWCEVVNRGDYWERLGLYPSRNFESRACLVTNELDDWGAKPGNVTRNSSIGRLYVYAGGLDILKFDKLN